MMNYIKNRTKSNDISKRKFDRLICKHLNIPESVSLSRDDYIYFYRRNFFVNNRWKYSAIKKFYSGLDSDLKSEFKSNLKHFKSNKTNDVLTEMFKKLDSGDSIIINKKDLMQIIRTLTELKKNGNLSLSYKSISAGIINGFSSDYSQSYIEDLLQEKPFKP